MMKKIFISIFTGVILCSCNPDFNLEFNPTQSGGSEILNNTTSAISALNGIYRSMFKAGWSTTGNTHMAFGVAAYNIAQEAMGDDFIMQARGNGWFWADHCYYVKQYYTSTTYRSYDAWFGCYNWINNANNILDYKDVMSGNPEDMAYIIGQAYGVRAYSYFTLAGWFSRAPVNTLAYSAGERGKEVVRWDEACVPIYTTGTTTATIGKPRASIREVYDQINSDLDSAIFYLKKAEGSILDLGNKSHFTLWAALGYKSRVALAENDWEKAYDAAMEVIESGRFKIGGKSDLMNGMNSLSLPNVIWGSKVDNSEQSSAYMSFFGHMDNTNGAYAQSAPKRITKTLYTKMGANDIRRAWWDPEDEQTPYVSKKFSFANVSTSLGDPIYMRIEEMYFNAAEAAVRMSESDGSYLQTARSLLDAVVSQRDPSFSADKYSGTALGATTNVYRGSLLEYIILHKRLEFWGEFGRVIDIKRLGQGINRSADDGFATECLNTMTSKGVNITNPGTWDWVLYIPKKEIDSNPNINDEDQNP